MMYLLFEVLFFHLGISQVLKFLVVTRLLVTSYETVSCFSQLRQFLVATCSPSPDGEAILSS